MEVRFLINNTTVIIFIFCFQITFSDDDFLIGISGCVRTIKKFTVITLSSIKTNIKTYEPYGTNPEVEFSIGVTQGKIVGFMVRPRSFQGYPVVCNNVDKIFYNSNRLWVLC